MKILRERSAFTKQQGLQLIAVDLPPFLELSHETDSRISQKFPTNIDPFFLKSSKTEPKQCIGHYSKGMAETLIENLGFLQRPKVPFPEGMYPEIGQSLEEVALFPLETDLMLDRPEGLEDQRWREIVDFAQTVLQIEPCVFPLPQHPTSADSFEVAKLPLEVPIQRVQEGCSDRIGGGGMCFTCWSGWQGEGLGGQLLKLRVITLDGGLVDPMCAVGTAALTTGASLSFGSHLIEYKLLITCQRLYTQQRIPNRFILSEGKAKQGFLWQIYCQMRLRSRMQKYKRAC